MCAEYLSKSTSNDNNAYDYSDYKNNETAAQAAKSNVQMLRAVTPARGTRARKL